jgi:hypothetical protein
LSGEKEASNVLGLLTRIVTTSQQKTSLVSQLLTNSHQFTELNFRTDSQEPTTRPCPETNEYNLRPYSYYVSFIIILMARRKIPEWYSSFRVFRLHKLIYLISVEWVPHVRLISLYLICWP